jgi:hypothetical protein
MYHRAAVTLVEVLVAIFIAALGLMALLALFPLGALNMAQAIKDDRTAHAAANAEALAAARNLRHDPLVVAAFSNPGGGLPPAHPDRPSYPVYVDPVGVQSYQLVPDGSQWVAAAAGTIPRRMVTFLQPNPTLLTLRWFTLLDDITFADTGVPAMPAGQVQREGRYSWAYLLRRPRASVASVVDLTVVVYSQRPLQLTTAAFQPVGETAYAAVGARGSKVVTLAVGAGQRQPDLRKGSWILDASVVPTPIGTPPVQSVTVHGFFYRVVGLTEVNPTTMELELETSLKEALPQAGGRVVVMDNVAEVFDKGPGRVP